MKYGTCSLEYENFDYVELTFDHFAKIKNLDPSVTMVHIPTLNLAKEKHREWFLKVCEENPTVSMVIHFHKGRMESPKIKANWLAGLCKILGKVKNRIFLENCHGFTEFWSLEDQLDAIEVGKNFSNFAFCLDLGHAWTLGGGRKWIDKLLETGTVKHCHAHDARGHKIRFKKTEWIDHLKIGEGEIDYSFLRNSGIETITLEYYATNEELEAGRRIIEKILMN